jgi:hypothetical protein
MNERIEKLAEQVDLLGNFTPTKVPGHYAGIIKTVDIEKFAELIVRECTNIVLHYTDVDEGVAVAKKHFGVEE